MNPNRARVIPELPGSSREEADVTTPSQEGRPEMEAAIAGLLAVHRIYQRAAVPNGGLLCACGLTFEGWITATEHQAAALAAVVVSSPATPNGGLYGERCAYCLKRWGHALDCAVMLGTEPAASPATPNGQGEEEPGAAFAALKARGDYWKGRALAAEVTTPSPASPAETGANSKLRQVAPSLGATPSAPSPAETREGREAAWRREIEAALLGAFETCDTFERLIIGVIRTAMNYADGEIAAARASHDATRCRPETCGGIGYDPCAAASPAAVPLPEETELAAHLTLLLADIEDTRDTPVPEQSGWLPQRHWIGRRLRAILTTHGIAAPSLPGEQPRRAAMSGWMHSFETAEAMCEMWGHPVDADGWCACGEKSPALPVERAAGTEK